MKCNIDAHGRAARLRAGIAACVGGLLIGLASMLDIVHADWLVIVSLAMLVSGVIAVCEARAGWCVIRAMGFKTRI